MAAPKKTEQDYFQEGQEANRSGKPRSANPYDWSSYMHAAASHWDQGWDSEQKAMYGND